MEDHYLSLRPSEKAEDAEWAAIGDETVRRSWGEPRQ
jgi:hypothetical protein